MKTLWLETVGDAMERFFKFILGIILANLILGTSALAANFNLRIFVSSEGKDDARGSFSKPIAGRFDPNGTNSADTFEVDIFVSGVFDCQVFNWVHSHKNVHLKVSNISNQVAEFNGHREGCYDSGPNGITFFTAYGLSSDLKEYKGYSGYGSIKIQGLTIKHYGTGINLSAWPEIKPGKIEILNNVFYKIGELVNPGVWDPRYTAVKVKNIDGIEIMNNRFIKIANLVETSLMHAVYFVRSDFAVVRGNHFENVSGPPLKFRDGSDKAIVENNHFLRGGYSTHYYPIQNWYNNWWLSDAEAGEDREIPSFDVRVDNNTYVEIENDVTFLYKP